MRLREGVQQQRAGGAPDADRRAWFGDEVMRLLPELIAAARRFTATHADAEDVVAESVAKAWSHLDSLASRSSFRGWLFRIVTNTAISHRRGRAAERHEPLDEESVEGEFSLFERLHQPFLLWWGSTEREFLARLLREDLERAVDALPDDFRAVVVLADIQGLSYAETADALGIPVGTVRSRLARARARLQRALWAHAQDAGLA